MNRIKLGFGLLGIILVAVIYYFNHAEHTKNLNTLKESLNLQLTQMRTNGFTVSDRELKNDSEHFVIQINDSKKAALFLTQKGIQITIEEAEDLKGMKIAADVKYLEDIIALDIYPLTVPTYLVNAVSTENDKKVLRQIEDMIKRKTFFIHVDVVHSTTTFTGYLKDIDERVEGEKEIKLTLQGLHFSGDIKEERVVQYMQKFKTLHLYMDNEINRTISGYQSQYALTGTTAYDYTTDYSIEKIKIDDEAEGTFFADTIVLSSSSRVKDGLATEMLQTKIKNLDLTFEKEKFGMHRLVLDMNISNLDVDTLEKLQKTDQKTKKSLDSHLETRVSNKMHLDIANLSVDKVTLHGKKMNGFTFDAKLDVDESLDIYDLGIKPKHALKKMEGDINLSLSKEILELLKEDPKFMLIYMMYRPQRVLEQRNYVIQIKRDELKINGKAVKEF